MMRNEKVTKKSATALIYSKFGGELCFNPLTNELSSLFIKHFLAKISVVDNVILNY